MMILYHTYASWWQSHFDDVIPSGDGTVVAVSEHCAELMEVWIVM